MPKLVLRIAEMVVDDTKALLLFSFLQFLLFHIHLLNKEDACLGLYKAFWPLAIYSFFVEKLKINRPAGFEPATSAV